jgi:hypothetical protein
LEEEERSDGGSGRDAEGTQALRGREGRGEDQGEGNMLEFKGREVDQAVGRLLAKKPAISEAMENALGPIWCPMKGIEVKDLGENIFLFMFLQATRKKKAVDNGPWMFDRDLLVTEEYDAGKTFDDYKFDKIPIWVRVHKLPLGKMDGCTGELIGNRIGEFMEVDGLVDGMAVGKCLWVKVRMMITKPLMRGTMVEIDGGKQAIWCPFEYEYCQDFCFVCGYIGHIDKDYERRLKKGEDPQFGRWLKWIPPRRTSFSNNRRSWNEGGRRMGSWGSGSSARGSDAKSWRKQDSGSKDSNKSLEEEKEVTSPMKITDGKEAGGFWRGRSILALKLKGMMEIRGGRRSWVREKRVMQTGVLLGVKTVRRRRDGLEAVRLIRKRKGMLEKKRWRTMCWLVVERHQNRNKGSIIR